MLGAKAQGCQRPCPHLCPRGRVDIVAGSDCIPSQESRSDEIALPRGQAKPQIQVSMESARGQKLL
jgi:hypothetical protein